ncbi:divalent-cation tolerance protein CutA [Streptomyces kunmingensis]|uniref:Divalent-cation tolerance protein CutA n=1 Tax=Streptomyces kunmingensis TaxID=68225 RepID=A0ABU6CNR0_9ACTN|nr:divalent-cation tolerance protein CutA [Streptomyces kunmingensis]MEB3966359.1 divalent-cation tolerance protein CutA [Streptomyces kunmingensis]
MTDYLQVATATATRDEAIRLVEPIVRGQLAAGAQIIGPVVSAFWHAGEFGTGEEYRILFKSRSDRYPQLESAIREHHPWDRPEINAVAFTEFSDEYRDWVDKTLG